MNVRRACLTISFSVCVTSLSCTLRAVSFCFVFGSNVVLSDVDPAIPENRG